MVFPRRYGFCIYDETIALRSSSIHMQCIHAGHRLPLPTLATTVERFPYLLVR